MRQSVKLLIELGCVLLLFCMAAMLIFRQTPLGLATTPDSLSYLDMAANAHQGHGLLASNFEFNPDGAREYVEQRLWPRLYPWLLSWVVNEMSAVQKAVSISIMLLGVSLLGIYLYCRQFLTPSISMVAALAFAVTVPVTTIYNYVWSETLFMPALIWLAYSATLYFSLLARKSHGRWLAGICLLTLLVALAYTRYVGIVFAGLLPLLMVVASDKRDRIFWLVSSLFYVLLIGSMLYGNYEITGHFSGGVRQPSDKGVLVLLQSLAGVASVIVYSGMLVNIAIAMVGMVAVITLQRQWQESVRDVIRYIHIGIPVFLGMLYLLAIIALRAYSQFDDLDVRLLSPMMPLIWLLGIALVPNLFRNKFLSMASSVLALTIVVNFTIAGYFHWQRNVESWKQFGEPEQWRMHGEQYLNFTSHRFAPLSRELQELTASSGVLLFQTPILLQFITNKPAFQLPGLQKENDIVQLNALPEGSVMMLSAQNSEWTTLAQHLSLAYESREFMGWLLVKTPIVIVKKE